MFQAQPQLYSSLGDGFRKIHAAEGMKGFTLVSFLLAINRHFLLLKRSLAVLRTSRRHNRLPHLLKALGRRTHNQEYLVSYTFDSNTLICSTRDGSPRSLATVSRASESLDSTKCSRMCTRAFSEKRPLSTRLSVSLSPPPAPRSSLTSSSAHGKP